MENQVKDLPILLTVEEMTNFLNIGRNKAYNLIYKKNVPVLRVGCQIRIPKCLFVKWINDNVGAINSY